MAELVVRNIEAETKLRRQRRAKLHGRSMEEEAPDILRDAVKLESASVGRLRTEIASMFTKAGLDAVIPEIRGDEIKPAPFDR